MPSTRIKNLAYRCLLPFKAPVPDRDPVAVFSGHPICAQKELSRILRKHRVLGGSLLIEKENEQTVVLSRCSRTNQTAASDSMFRVASITKTATALLVLRLRDKGSLDLSVPVSEMLPDSRDLRELNGVTLMHLLSHTSGLADPAGLEALLESGAPFHDAVRNARFADPGTSFRYSNLGFGLIGCVLEAVSGLPLGDLFREELFEPLGMNATLEGCLLPQEKIMPVVRVLPYRPGSRLLVTELGKKPLTLPDPLRHYGHTAGSMYTDILSLYQLFKMLASDGNGFISSSALNDMKAKHASYGRLSPTLSYGLGLLRISDPFVSDNIVYGHQGFAYGCADGAFWDDRTKCLFITLNGGCSEARKGRLGAANRDLLHWAYRKELPSWSE